MRRIVREIVHTVTVERWLVEETAPADADPTLPPADADTPTANPSTKSKPRRPRKPSTARRKKTKR